MKYNKIDGTDVSAVGFGCYALSGAYGSVNTQEYERVIKRALKLGVTLFDTADTYGEQAERLLGGSVKDVRDDVFISTKVGVTEGNKPDLSYDTVIQACRNSLDRLQTDHIDLYMVHFDDPSTPIEETVEAMEYLLEQGMIGRYGVSHLPYERIEEYIDIGDPSALMFEYSPVAMDAEKHLFPLCRKHDLGAIAFSVTGRGILTGKITKKTEFEKGDIRRNDPLFKHARFASAIRRMKKLKEIGESYDKSPVQMAIAWVLSHPEISSALTGPSSTEHMEENVEAADFEIPPEDLRELNLFFREDNLRMIEEEGELIKELLKNPLDHEKGFSDLIYVMETAILQDMAGESDLMPLFMELWSMKEDPDSDVMEDVQRVLKDRLL
ncbi:MAG: aldo/keto reductase [Thermoplasmata archaeon]